MLSAEVEHLVIQQGQVRCDHELKLLPEGNRPLLRGQDNPSDEFEVQERLASLKLDLDQRSRCRQGNIQRLRGRGLVHVVADAVLALARDLAIRAGMLAPQRDNEQVERRGCSQKTQAATQAKRQELLL